jgi:hypothetical protein
MGPVGADDGWRMPDGRIELATFAVAATRVQVKWARVRCRPLTPSAFGACEPVTSMAPESPWYAGLLP